MLSEHDAGLLPAEPSMYKSNSRPCFLLTHSRGHLSSAHLGRIELLRSGGQGPGKLPCLSRCSDSAARQDGLVRQTYGVLSKHLFLVLSLFLLIFHRGCLEPSLGDVWSGSMEDQRDPV